MENASKALIIAGAILVSILLISLGIVVYNSANGATSETENVNKAIKQGISTAITDMSTEIQSRHQRVK